MSVTGSGDKREWGAVDTPHEQSINDKAPKMTRLDSADKDIKLMDLDVDKIEIDPVLKDGSIGDKYCEVKYNGSLVVLKFDDVPGWRRSPFKAGPAKKADGTQLGESWGMVVELNPEEYEKYREIEQHLIAKLSPRATELMGHTLKKPQPGKPAKKISATEFEDSYNSPLRAADAEKGWKATMRIGVQHEQTNKDGKPRKMPDINLSEYYGGNDMTPKEVGSIDDLNRNIAMCPTITLSRGIYFGNTGWGIKFMLKSALIFTNLSINSSRSLSTAHMNIVPKSKDEQEKKSTLNLTDEFGSSVVEENVSD